MLINEIFSSIDGEGIRTGFLTTFIRTFGCNLRCNYCDTMYAVEDQMNLLGEKPFKEMSIGEIIVECQGLKNQRITLTGGEPLLQKDAEELVKALIKEGFEVNIETNGAIDISNYAYMQNLDMSKLIITMDWKSPYSGMNDKMIESNLEKLRVIDVLKFVVASKEDLDDMKCVITENDIWCNIFVSPVFGEIEGSDIVEYIKQNNLQNVRVQCQLHKIFWDPSKRGV